MSESGDAEGTTESNAGKVSRRRALTGAAGVIVGAIAAETLGSEAASAAGATQTTGTPLILGKSNSESAPTKLSNSGKGAALEVYNKTEPFSAATIAAARAGVIGTVTDGYAITTVDFVGLAGVAGAASGGPAGALGVLGISGATGLTSGSAAGVVGFSGQGNAFGFQLPGELGVVGIAGSGYVTGSSTSVTVAAAGVEGVGVGAGVVGVGAIGYNDALALQVIGDAQFSTSGSATIPAGASSVTVKDRGVTSTSHVSVTLTSSPGTTTVSWVQRQPGHGFTVHLTGAAATAVSLSYLRTQ